MTSRLFQTMMLVIKKKIIQSAVIPAPPPIPAPPCKRLGLQTLNWKSLQICGAFRNQTMFLSKRVTQLNKDPDGSLKEEKVKL